ELVSRRLQAAGHVLQFFLAACKFLLQTRLCCLVRRCFTEHALGADKADLGRLLSLRDRNTAQTGKQDGCAFINDRRCDVGLQNCSPHFMLRSPGEYYASDNHQKPVPSWNWKAWVLSRSLRSPLLFAFSGRPKLSLSGPIGETQLKPIPTEYLRSLPKLVCSPNVSSVL